MELSKFQYGCFVNLTCKIEIVTREFEFVDLNS